MVIDVYFWNHMHSMCSWWRCVSHLLPSAPSIMSDYKDEGEKYQLVQPDMYFIT